MDKTFAAMHTWYFLTYPDKMIFAWLTSHIASIHTNCTQQETHANAFHFIPICIDSSREDLQEFFGCLAGAGLEHLAEMTYLDTKRNANKLFQKYSGGRMPFNVVVGGDGRIRFARIGLSTSSADDPLSMAALVEAIRSGL